MSLMKTIYGKTKKQWRLNALNLGVLKEMFGSFMIKIQTYGHGQRVPCDTLSKRLFTSLTPEINRYTGDVSQLDIEVNGESRPSDKGCGGRGRPKKICFRLGLILV